MATIEKFNSKITIITGQPANGKTTIGRLLYSQAGFPYIEGDAYITPIGKTRLNNGSWDDTDRRIYLSRMAADAVELSFNHPDVIVVDCLTTRWMREFLVGQIHAVNQMLAVGFILLERNLSSCDIDTIAALRVSQGHALDKYALVRYRNAFEPWDPGLNPYLTLTNPGDGNWQQLLASTLVTLNSLWNF